MDYGIVVIGTSLGGLHALRTVMHGLPDHFPLPIAVVQHRDRNSGELLSTYLQDYSGMEVAEVCDKDPIVPGHVFIAPPDYHLMVEDGCFSLSTEAPILYSSPSIDILFESAAFVYGVHTIGILLTGANRDGAHGMAEIKRHGGLTIAQNPEMAECGVMPESAVALGVVDKILPLEAINEFLAELVGNKPAEGDRSYGNKL